MRGSALVLVLFVAGCGRSGTLQDALPGSFPLPNGPASATPTGSATPTPAITPPLTLGPEDLGDGGAGSPDISGTTLAVNDCAPIEQVTGGAVLVTNAPGSFITGNRVLLLQMTEDWTGVSGDATALGGANEPGAAGIWQLAEIVSALPDGGATTSLTTDPAPSGHFGSTPGGRAAQACFVPEYSSFRLRTDGIVTASQPWDGATGGVIAFVVSGDARIEGLVSVEAAGLRGGDVHGAAGDGTNELALDASPTTGGGKGESVDALAWTIDGRGNRGNGGGGGNAHNAGGAGGGHATAGGRGGADRCEASDATCGGAPSDNLTFGMPGAAIGFPFPDRLFSGGGGGAGHSNDTGDGFGGAGGGIILIFAGSFRGTGALLSAAGEAGFASTADGAGGGGAGGTIWLSAETAAIAFDATLSVRGGAGGMSSDVAVVQGPGGGGAGGRARLQGPFLGTQTVLLDGGVAGKCSVPAYSESLGATDGGIGSVEIN